MADTKKTTKAKLSPPDRTEHEDMMGRIQKEINDFYAQLQELNKKIGEKSTGKEEFIRRKEDMKLKLQEYQDIISKHEEEKQKYYTEIKATQNAGKSMRDDMKKMKGQKIAGIEMNIRSLEDIDKKISDLEYKMWTTSVTLKEEKVMVAQIQALKAAKPQFQQVEKMQASMGAGQDSVVGPLRAKIDNLSNLIQEAREAKKQQMGQYQKLIEQRSKVMADMPELFEKRDGLNKQLGNAHMHRKALIEDFRRKEKEYNAHLAEVRQVKYDKQRADRLERQADNEARRVERTEAAEEEQPFLYETTLIDQCQTYCQGLIAVPEAKAEEEKKDLDTSNAPEGAKILKNKKDRDEEFFFAPKKKSKAKSKQAKEAKGPSDDDKIKHNVETLQIFAKVKINPPIKVGDVPEILEKLQKQRDSYKDKIAKWEADKEARAQQQAKNLAEAQAKLESLRAQAKEAREQSKKKEAEAGAAEEEEE